MRCWICGNIADSCEHRIKKSDVTKVHGKGPYKEKQSLVMIKDGREIPIQGPNSKALKYKKSLCRRCNDTRTQRYDDAYSAFIDHVEDNKEHILEKRMIKFIDVYGENAESEQRFLYKYFIKSFGCRIVETGRKVPKHLADIFDKNVFEINLFITFAVNEDKVNLPEELKMIGNGDLIYSKDDAGNFSATYYEYYSYLHICYWFNCDWDHGLGARWTADSLFLYLGSFSPLTFEQRKLTKAMRYKSNE